MLTIKLILNYVKCSHQVLRMSVEKKVKITNVGLTFQSKTLEVLNCTDDTRMLKLKVFENICKFQSRYWGDEDRVSK